ncbi:hypothetical protein PAPYR_4634 [Paratrimastix pyriformis]|uniref:Uncharacterized protein n=1 Tax=Paratrimastix pyriformis TaxID=342808 RepID=A0ABQ8UKJ6_9EUKA|nr:hypothetical protein PAPYR_4634 [Paratrimastix pyriformis]
MKPLSNTCQLDIVFHRHLARPDLMMRVPPQLPANAVASASIRCACSEIFHHPFPSPAIFCGLWYLDASVRAWHWSSRARPLTDALAERWATLVSLCPLLRTPVIPSLEIGPATQRPAQHRFYPLLLPLLWSPLHAQSTPQLRDKEGGGWRDDLVKCICARYERMRGLPPAPMMRLPPLPVMTVDEAELKRW